MKIYLFVPVFLSLWLIGFTYALRVMPADTQPRAVTGEPLNTLTLKSQCRLYHIRVHGVQVWKTREQRYLNSPDPRVRRHYLRVYQGLLRGLDEDKGACK